MTNPEYNFDTIPRRAGTGTAKFDLRERLFGRPDVIPMWVADMDFECPPQVREAIGRRAAHNVYGYDLSSEPSRRSVRSWLSRRGGWAVEEDWMRFTTGVVAGLGFAVRAFTSRGDGVVIQPPIYPPFRSMVEANGRRVVENPLTEDFRMDFENLERCFEGGAKAIILCNPHNPVGRVFNRDELVRLGELCERYDVTIISDEIHSDLVFAPHRHTHIASLSARTAARTITFVAPSKTFNIAGLATSAAIIPAAEMREKWDAGYSKMHVIDGTLFGHIALRAAYDECEGWLDALIPYIKGNVDYVRRFLAERVPGVRCTEPEGTYLMWLDFRALNFGSHGELMTWLAREAGLGLSSGADFGCKGGGSGCVGGSDGSGLGSDDGISGSCSGCDGVGFARLNAATNRATIERAMAQLEAATAALRLA